MKGSVNGGARTVLRLEGLCLLIAATVCYTRTGQGWGFYFALFLVPDLGMLGYLAGPRLGALSYNATHSLIGALALAVFAMVSASTVVMAVALVWIAHIGFDRALGYGLKYASAFTDTHLGRIGRRSAG